MQCPCHQFLAGARLARNEHRRHAARDFGNPLLDHAHGHRIPHQALQRRLPDALHRVGTAAVGAHARGIAGGMAAPRDGLVSGPQDGRRHHGAKLLDVHRLGEIVEGAGLQRLDRVLRRAVSRDHDTTFGPLLFAQPVQQADAQTIGQPHVGDDHVETLPRQMLPGIVQVADALNVIALAQQRQFVQGTQIGLVVHDQNLRIAQGRFCCHGVTAILSDAPAVPPGARGANASSVIRNSLPSTWDPAMGLWLRSKPIAAPCRWHNSRQM